MSTLRESLSDADIKKLDTFLKTVNKVYRSSEGQKQISDNTAIKFLHARKFDLERAFELYKSHEVTRYQERINSISLDSDECLIQELKSAKFTVLGQRDENGSAIAIFTAKLHSPMSKVFENKEETRRKAQHNTLKGLVYQLDAALEDIDNQKNGIIFLYNMSQSVYSNFDYELCFKILNLLKGAFPAKLKKVLIISPPLWFRAPFHFLRLIIREKLRNRVFLIERSHLTKHLNKESLPPELGGVCIHDHSKWMDTCKIRHKRLTDLCDTKSAIQILEEQHSSKNQNNKTSTLVPSGNLNQTRDVVTSTLSPQLSGSSQVPVGGLKSCNYDYDGEGQTLQQFVVSLREKGEKGLIAEYDEILSTEKVGTFLASSMHANIHKNRYFNIKCYDHTRVILSTDDINSSTQNSNDYINANYVDGYCQPYAYISTQGPLDKTTVDFWRMVWQTGSRVIVMVTQAFENGMEKCDRYWPDENFSLECGVYKVEYKGKEIQDDYTLTNISLKNTKSDVTREIYHFQFTSWPDFGVPQSAASLLKFRERILKKQLDAEPLNNTTPYPSIIVHCSAGVGRSGTFITIDISLHKFDTTGMIDIKGVVEKLRQQRYSSIQTKDQYIFCHAAILEYATMYGLLNDIDDKDKIIT